MKRSLGLAVFAAALAPLPCSAQFGGMGGGAPPQAPVWAVKVEMAGDRNLTGKIALAALTVDCDFGRYEINPAKIKVVRFAPVDEKSAPPGPMFGAGIPGTVATTSGEEIKGLVYVPNSGIETELGRLTPNPRGLRSMTFAGRAEEKKAREKPGN